MKIGNNADEKKCTQDDQIPYLLLQKDMLNINLLLVLPLAMPGKVTWLVVHMTILHFH